MVGPRQGEAPGSTFGFGRFRRLSKLSVRQGAPNDSLPPEPAGAPLSHPAAKHGSVWTYTLVDYDPERNGDEEAWAARSRR